jgi:uncharacterized protein YciI
LFPCMLIYRKLPRKVGQSMDFDRFTIGLLILRADAPKLSEEEGNRLQDAHMAHLAKLHDQGILLAAGPLLGSSDRDLRGLEIYSGSPDEVRALADRDPAVLAGRFTHRFLLWMVPGGAVSFVHTRFPRSMAEV